MDFASLALQVAPVSYYCLIFFIGLRPKLGKTYYLLSYRPHPDDDISLEPLSQSLSRINPSSKSVIIVGRDFNLGHMDWENQIKNNINRF